MDNRQDHVQFWKSRSYRGSPLNLTVGDYPDLKPWGWAYEISSMQIPSGLQVTMYRDANFGGDSKTFGPGDHYGVYENLNTTKYNDYGRSLKIQDIN